MTFRDYLRELLFPIESTTTMIAIVTFYLLVSLAARAGLFGIWLAVIVIPALFRYIVFIAEARARDADAAPPGIEIFMVGNYWALFPVVPVVAGAYAIYFVGTTVGVAAASTAAILFAFVFPASIAVIVITKSPLQSLNPVAIGELIKQTWPDYLYAPATAVLIVLIPVWVDFLPFWAESLLELYLLFAFAAVTGAITRKGNLIEQVFIDSGFEPDVDDQVANLEKERTTVLNHGYGLASRGNREGGLSHIYAWLMRDPDPVEAWQWFFEQMLKWEQNEHALYFAQEYIHWLLKQGENVRAVKVIQRGRLQNERFKPKAEDMGAAIEAADSCGNPELADALRRL